MIQTFSEFAKAKCKTVNEDWDAFEGEHLVNARPIKGRQELIYNTNWEDPSLEPNIIRVVSNRWWAIPYKDTVIVGAPDADNVYVLYDDTCDCCVVDVLGCTPTGKFASIWPNATTMEEMSAFISALVDPTLPYEKLMENHENSFPVLCGEMGGLTAGGLQIDEPWMSQLFRDTQGLNESRLYNASDDNVTVDCELAGELTGNPIEYLEVLQNKYGENIIGMMDYVVLCPVGSKTQVWIHTGAEFDSESGAEGANAAYTAGDVVPSALVNDPNYAKAMRIIRTFDADSAKGEQWYAYISAYYAELENLA